MSDPAPAPGSDPAAGVKALVDALVLAVTDKVTADQALTSAQTELSHARTAQLTAAERAAAAQARFGAAITPLTTQPFHLMSLTDMFRAGTSRLAAGSKLLSHPLSMLVMGVVLTVTATHARLPLPLPWPTPAPAPGPAPSPVPPARAVTPLYAVQAYFPESPSAESLAAASVRADVRTAATLKTLGVNFRALPSTADDWDTHKLRGYLPDPAKLPILLIYDAKGQFYDLAGQALDRSKPVYQPHPATYADLLAVFTKIRGK